ncbi:MAG TPA: alpha/beta hydrolase [Bacteroides sp.]|nr:alpha/beta hydrolase [Bacteroides sp.]
MERLKVAISRMNSDLFILLSTTSIRDFFLFIRLDMDNQNNDVQMKFHYMIITAALCFSGIFSCTKTDEPGALVPATVDEDPGLPSIAISVGGHQRLIHYRVFGDSARPVLFIMHGSLSDMRAYLPLQELAERYRVVMWDQRGNGLSERVSKEELSFECMVQEISRVKSHFSPGRQISILGHSWSAVFVARYLAEYPGEVDQAILMEPFGLKDAFMESLDGMLNLGTSGFMNMMYTSSYLTPRDHEILDFRMLATLRSGVRDYFCDCENLPDWPVWRVGGYALLTWESGILEKGRYRYDFTVGMGEFDGEVLLVGSECSPVGYAFQEEFHAGLFRNAAVLRIQNSGHRIITENYPSLINGLKEFLNAYKQAE